jgi:hypothetical protein
MFESVFPPELLVLDTPPHPIPANVRARVEVVKTELSTKRREAFIFFTLYMGTDLRGRAVA